MKAAQPVSARSRRTLVAIPVVLAMLSMVGPFSVDTPFPAFAQMGADFGVGSHEMQLVVTTYLIAFGAMSVFHGPLSDAVGRRPVMVGGIVVYVVASLGAALSPTLPVLLAFRVLQGLSAGGGVIVSRTVIRDLFEGARAQRLMSQVAMIFGLAPAIAPIIGGFLLQTGPWPLIFFFQAGLGLALIAAVLVVLPETHPSHARTPLRVGALVGGLVAVFRLPDFHRVSWAATLAFGGQFLYIGGAAIFVIDLLGLGELDFWVFFVPMIGSMVVGSWVSVRTAGRVSGRRLVTAGLAFATVAALAGVGLAASPVASDLPWPVVGPSLIALGIGAAYPTLQLMMLDLFPERRGAVVSAATFMTLTFNGLAAVLITPVVARSLLGLAVATCVLVLLGLLSWVWHLRATRSQVPPPL